MPQRILIWVEKKSRRAETVRLPWSSLAWVSHLICTCHQNMAPGSQIAESYQGGCGRESGKEGDPPTHAAPRLPHYTTLPAGCWLSVYLHTAAPSPCVMYEWCGASDWSVVTILSSDWLSPVLRRPVCGESLHLQSRPAACAAVFWLRLTTLEQAEGRETQKLHSCSRWCLTSFKVMEWKFTREMSYT